jgi:argininosuccinate lyase
MAEMLAGSTPRIERMAEVSGATFSTATDYADYLAKKGLPFREAHRVIGELVRTCEERGCDLGDLTLADLKAASSLFEADILGLTPVAVAAARDVIGGTAPARVDAERAAARERLAILDRESERRRAALPSLNTLLTSPLDAS